MKNTNISHHHALFCDLPEAANKMAPCPTPPYAMSNSDLSFFEYTMYKRY